MAELWEKVERPEMGLMGVSSVQLTRVFFSGLKDLQRRGRAAAEEEDGHEGEATVKSGVEQRLRGLRNANEITSVRIQVLRGPRSIVGIAVLDLSGNLSILFLTSKYELGSCLSWGW